MKDKVKYIYGENSLTDKEMKEVTQLVYDVIFIKNKPPSGKEAGAWLECQKVVEAVLWYLFNQKATHEES